MNKKILHKEVQEFIFEKSNTSIDLNKLILRGSPFVDISIQEIAQQINGRLKAKQKLPTWFSKKGIYYPPTLNLEQTSSEATAIYKSSLVSGDTLIDLTGGFGIDDYFFSKKMQHVIHCELNIDLSAIAKYNFDLLDVKNIKSLTGDGVTILKNFEKLDWIYIDPSRRHDSKGKVFFLEDCIPNVIDNLDILFAKSKNILIKTSPLLDIHLGVNALKYVKEIHVVAVENEVKELLWILEKSFDGDCIIKTINITKNRTHEFSFSLKEEVKQSIYYSEPKAFLYEPNAAILKSGGFLSVGNAFEVKKLHLHSHLYTSDQKIDFPGRRFEVITTFLYHKKTISKAGITKANITTRNFPESVAVLRKKHKIKDGGDNYLFFTTNCNNKRIVILCKKIQG
ncbi:class I SAM-dependent methyltransferase [Aquimarina mytili]|uniref:Class I SAM-dependent methyltransferase n=1 Tax=Aquimarina mytili TaxID=874423 RepID=A0A936ZPF2_9FLAO|nr:class I SAM-dependent methyltransferase [Aquimarina mytili]MBL0683324.1 class I SAM-dependent methyltransferase [Aquimarina mytili]